MGFKDWVIEHTRTRMVVRMETDYCSHPGEGFRAALFAQTNPSRGPVVFGQLITLVSGSDVEYINLWASVNEDEWRGHMPGLSGRLRPDWLVQEERLITQGTRNAFRGHSLSLGSLVVIQHLACLQGVVMGASNRTREAHEIALLNEMSHNLRALRNDALREHLVGLPRAEE